jgi:biopolymer transport protein TolR
LPTICAKWHSRHRAGLGPKAMSFGRLERARASAPMSDINMTPLIDVMLVLLVIFILTAPLMTSNLPLNLPKAGGQPTDSAPSALNVGLNAQGQLFLDDKPVERAALSERAKTAAQRSADTEVRLQADEKVPYGQVAELMALLQEAGLTRIGFITTHK